MEGLGDVVGNDGNVVGTGAGAGAKHSSLFFVDTNTKRPYPLLDEDGDDSLINTSSSRPLSATTTNENKNNTTANDLSNSIMIEGDEEEEEEEDKDDKNANTNQQPSIRLFGQFQSIFRDWQRVVSRNKTRPMHSFADSPLPAIGIQRAAGASPDGGRRNNISHSIRIA